ncbi:DUF4124 domain-containing protein [Microbulbifer epialgicus]|uniref:DUF4124 domain-containing protein n=1 Tax=Microbulbifer epialgicus TaxID=393907 RepID=A0ABV4NW73_9GAMM
MEKFQGVLFGSLLLAAATNAGELYRWVDEDGQVHFSDRRPAGAKAQDISRQLGPINSVDATKAPLSTAAVSRQPREIEREYEQREQKEQQKRQQEKQRICTEARRRLNILNGRVAFFDKDGQEVHYSDRDREQMAEKFKREISRRCG